MGKDQLAALIQVLQQQLTLGQGGVVLGTWSIVYDKAAEAFQFQKCEAGDYCEERPAIVALDGSVMDRGGPLLQAR